MMHPMLKKKTHFTIAVLELYKSEIHSPRLASPTQEKKRTPDSRDGKKCFESCLCCTLQVLLYLQCFVFLWDGCTRTLLLLILFICMYKTIYLSSQQEPQPLPAISFLLKNCYIWVMSTQRMVYISNVNPNKKYYIWVITHLRLVHSRGQRINN